MKYKLVKLKDEKFNGLHPNGIFEGDTRIGHISKKPIVGERYHFGTGLDHPKNHLWTSTVIELLNDNKFRTRNSIYELIEIEEEG